MNTVNDLKAWLEDIPGDTLILQEHPFNSLGIVSASRSNHVSCDLRIDFARINRKTGKAAIKDKLPNSTKQFRRAIVIRRPWTYVEPESEEE